MLYTDLIYITFREAGSFHMGEFVPGDIIETISVRASVQPTSGRDLEALPEGEREKVIYTVYTSKPIDMLSQADFCNYKNGDYKILLEQNWKQAPFLPHNRFYLQRKGDV